MTLYRGLRATLLPVALILLTPAARAQFTPINQPDLAYTSGTTLLPITAANFGLVPALADSFLTVNITSNVGPLFAATVPTSYAFWATPPQVETATPRVIGQTFNSTTTLTFSSAVTTFGFEANVNNSNRNVTATFFSGATPIGSITRPVGDSGVGANLFAATSTTPFDRVELVDAVRVGPGTTIAQIRYAGVSAAAPEPGTITFVVWAIGGGAFARRRRKRNRARR
jgi:hypothetical protein